MTRCRDLIDFILEPGVARACFARGGRKVKSKLLSVQTMSVPQGRPKFGPAEMCVYIYVCIYYIYI